MAPSRTARAVSVNCVRATGKSRHRRRFCPKSWRFAHRATKSLAAPMPLLHQDTSRGGGGSNDKRLSLADLLGLDQAQQVESAVTPRMNHRTNGNDEWRWEEPGSPTVAQTPSSFVPPACFPPRHPRNFASYSESARPGSGWPADDPPVENMTDLVSSLKSLAMPTARSMHTSIQVRLSYDKLDNVVDSWATDQNSLFNRETNLQRRASFCGAMPSQSNLSLEPARWCGALPARELDVSAPFSPKVFLGGLPWDITEPALLATLRHFQPIRVEWPGRESANSPRGFAYVTFDSERRVKALLAASRRDGNDWYYRVATRKMRSKEVQVIPWAVDEANWVVGGSVRLEPRSTVFVGALHGMISAAALARVMNDLFGGVVYAGIDTDKNKYPIGSGRVTFNNVKSYIQAISAAYVEICTDKFVKKVQVDPYLEDSPCSVCKLTQGPYFCREPVCFRYFCRSCWAWQHAAERHKRLMRKSASHYANNADGTPSPSSGTSGTSGTSEFEQHNDDHSDGHWH